MTDHLFPRVPVRQFVVSFPFPLRLWLAAGKGLMSRVCCLVCSIIKSFVLQAASHQGNAAQDPTLKTGLVCFVQRFGSALNLNPHFHILSLDGAFRLQDDSTPQFLTMPAPTNQSIALLVRSISDHVNSLLIDEGFLREEEGQVTLEDTTDLFKPDVDTDVHLPAMAASISQKIAFGPRAGQPVKRLFTTGPAGCSWSDPESTTVTGPCCASHGGYSLHANTCIPNHDKHRLEKLITYVARGPIADERLERVGDETVRVRLKTPWKDGTTHLEFSFSEFMEKLVALIPPPWFHMVRYFGVFVSNALGREKIVPQMIEGQNSQAKKSPSKISKAKGKKKSKRMRWADLLKRVFGIDVETCRICKGKVKIAQALFPGELLTLTLKGLKLSTSPPKLAPAKNSRLFFD
jgi:hypothetical protein